MYLWPFGHKEDATLVPQRFISPGAGKDVNGKQLCDNHAFCFMCVSDFKQNKLRSATADAAFITKGYQKWKDATAAFRNYEGSAYHKKAVVKMVTIIATHHDVGECL